VDSNLTVQIGRYSKMHVLLTDLIWVLQFWSGGCDGKLEYCSFMTCLQQVRESAPVGNHFRLCNNEIFRLAIFWTNRPSMLFFWGIFYSYIFNCENMSFLRIYPIYFVRFRSISDLHPKSDIIRIRIRIRSFSAPLQTRQKIWWRIWREHYPIRSINNPNWTW
jgi:hypothetical protein